MSKLIERLNDLNKAGMPTMGFRSAGAGAKPLSMLVIAGLTGKPEGEPKALDGCGAAAAVIEGAGLTAAALAKYVKGAGDISLGLNLSGAKGSAGWKLVNGGTDFIIFGIDTPLNAFEGKDMEKLGKVLALSADMEPGLLRSVHSLHPEIDAVIIDIRSSGMTVETLMNCRRVADIAGQPLLAMAGGLPSETQLLALRGAGVKGIVLPQDISVEEVKEIVERVAALPRPEKRKEKDAVPLLPRFGLAPAAKKDDDDGEDGGEEGE